MHTPPVSADETLYFCTPSRVLLAAGARHRVAALCAAQRWRCALIVTDRHFSSRTTVVDELVRSLQAEGLGALVFDGGEPDPSTELCDSATDELLAREGAARIDHVIALGGGSNIDLAKALCLTLPFRRPVASFVGTTRFPGNPLPMLAMPTTSGTGSEITPGAILLQHSSATKVAVMGNALRPAIAVIDPELTLSCPPKVTADAGLDALTHAIESYLTMDATRFDTGGDADPSYSGRNRLTTMFAREAITLCFQHLRRAYLVPDDLQARTGMAYASLFAAMSYASAGLNAVHGLAYALAGLTHASHGSTNAALLPYVMDALRPSRREELADIAAMAGVPRADSDAMARQASVKTRELVRELGVPVDLAAFGVPERALDQLVHDGLAVARLAKAFPQQPPDADYAAIVRRAYAGELSGIETP
ncbi:MULTISPECIES: iron-containing alcohol dehydrogenase [unclassified Methylibium]|uniref:iron-containing alcohol dehydrogenase n=1 Tax=unclassified Methylibium TaxID=2633235 RepID=UPI0006FAFBF7|nr:iron-containing alcohol dehydrogenase [Methylibium sp. Root1272]KQW68529.1 alcohol dehydrogenase [Methylibium sp. Root1272]